MDALPDTLRRFRSPTPEERGREDGKERPANSPAYDRTDVRLILLTLTLMISYTRSAGCCEWIAGTGGSCHKFLNELSMNLKEEKMAYSDQVTNRCL